MDKRIGNIIFLLMQCSIMAASVLDIQLRVKDAQGKALSRAVIHIPFVVEVIVTADDNGMYKPMLDGISKFHVEDQALVSTISSTINGVSSVKKIYRYVLRPDKEGTFTIGPAYIDYNNQRFSSHSFPLMVGQQQAEDLKSAEAFVRLVVDKKQGVIGEKIAFAIRFYGGKSATLSTISQPELSGFSYEPLSGPFSGSEVIDGVTWNYVEWRTDLFPKKSGSLVIPPVMALYQLPRQQRSHFGFDMIDRLFDAGNDQRNSYSNAVTIAVDELPPFAGILNGVGTFSALKALVDHAVAQEGEGIVLRLILEGDGDLNSIESLPLTMPESLKYYESKTSIEPKKDGRGNQKKIFEYIVQGVKPGHWIIPAQTFTYFDLVRHRYKQLSTDPIEITIEASQNNYHATAQNNLSPSLEKKQESQAEQPSDDSAPLMTRGPWRTSDQWELSLRWFMILMMLPVLIIMIGYGKRKIDYYNEHHAADVNAAAAFKHARSRLLKIKAKKSTDRLYDVFIELFARRYKLSQASVSHDWIQDLLQKKGFSEQIRTEWDLFFNALAEQAFFAQGHEYDQEQLQRALQWLDRLQEKL